MSNSLTYHFHGHIFDTSAIDLLSEYQREFNSITRLTLTYPQSRNGVASALKFLFPEAKLLPVSNKGRDFYPFQQSLRASSASPNDIIIKWHDKRRNHFSGFQLSMTERRNLLEYCLPDFEIGIPPLLIPFKKNENVSLSTIKGWLIPLSLRTGTNRNFLIQFCQQEGLQWENVFANSYFPAGGVFAVKYKSLQNSSWLKMDDMLIEYGHGGLDGTWAHASERWIGVLASKGGQFSEVSF
jgi:lipopolysaccharide biosynthesis protein